MVGFETKRKLFLECDRGGDFYYNLLKEVISHVQEKWMGMPDPASYTIHDVYHNENVEHNIYNLIPKNKFNLLNIREKFILLASVWLHDIGMIPLGLLPEDKEHEQRFNEYFRNQGVNQFYQNEDWIEYIKKIRSEHAIRSKRYILENIGKKTKKNSIFRYIEEVTQDPSIKNEFFENISIIAEICSLHTKQDTEQLVALCHPNWIKDPIRKPMIASYLRLADALHIANKGELQDIHGTFEKNINNDTYYHWLKSFFTDSIDINPEDHTITLNTITTDKINEKFPVNLNEKRPLDQRLINEIQEELEFIKHILCRSQISFYCEVKSKSVNYSNDSKKKKYLNIYYYFYYTLNELVILRYNDEKTPSSTLIEFEILQTICKMLEGNNNSEKEIKSLLLPFYYAIMIKEMGKRALQGNLLEINTIVKQFLGNDPNSIDFQEFSQKISEFKMKNENKLLFVAHNFRSEFASFIDSYSTVNIILYGYSATIHECLKELRHSRIHLNFFICAVGSKTKFSFNNILEFSDGIKNIEAIQKIFTGMNNYSINYLPDAVISHLIENIKSHKLEKTLVLLGTNAFDKESNIILTCGALVVAQSAHLYEIPVWVVVDKGKKVNFTIKNSQNQREHYWLASDPHSLTILSKCKSYNPREDMVPGKYISKIITD